MTGLLLKSFSNRISNNILGEFFKNINVFDFNASNAVSNTTYFFTLPNTGANTVQNGDTVRYYTEAGGTIIGGLANNNFYTVTSANTTGFKLANVSTGSTVAVISGSSETHHLSVENPSYYFAASKHSPWADDNDPDTPADNLQSVYDFQREMILGKIITRSDVAYMVRKITWVANTVYSHYDDTVESLFDTDFYVLTDENKIYKCIDNNNDSRSTVKPTGVLTTNFSTADGYVWKYMYTLSTANNSKFSTSDYIPVDANSSVSSAAVNGAVEFVQIETAGSGYRGFANGFIQQVISNTLFKVETSGTATTNGYYNNSALYIDAGTGSGQIAVVNDYIVNTTGHYISTATNLDSPALDTTSVYLISPQVKFYGDGTGLKAYANVAVAGNIYSISAINILNRGQNYSYCVAEIVANTAYGSGATLRPVLSPKSGHGYNQAEELGSSFISISVDFANNESTVVYTQPKFRKTGIIYSPVHYSNSQIYYKDSSFNALYSSEVTIDTAPTIFTEGEVVVGVTSNSHAVVAWSNSSHVLYSPQFGTFTTSETIVGQTSGATGSVVSVNSPDIKKFQNQVIYYDYVLPIQRSNTTTETAKLLIAI